MHFVFELQRCSILAGQRRIGIRATMVRVVRNFQLPRGSRRTVAPCWRWLVRLDLRRFLRHHRQGCGVSRNQCGVRHHATCFVDEALGLAERDDPTKYGLENLFPVPVPDRGEGRVVRHIVLGRQSTEPAIGQIAIDVLTKAPLGVNTVKIRHQLHAKVNFGINRRPSEAIGVAPGSQLMNER